MTKWLHHQVCPCGGFSGCFMSCEPGPLRRLDAETAEDLHHDRAAAGHGVGWIVLPTFHPHGPDCLLQDFAGQAIALPVVRLSPALRAEFWT